MHTKFHFTSRKTNIIAKHKVDKRKYSFAIHFSVKPFLFQLTMPARKIIFIISDYRTPLAADNDDLKNILITLVLSPNKVKAFRHMISTMMLHFSLAIICNQMNLISKKSVLSLQWPCLQIKLYQKTTLSSHIALKQFIFLYRYMEFLPGFGLVYKLVLAIFGVVAQNPASFHRILHWSAFCLQRVVEGLSEMITDYQTTQNKHSNQRQVSLRPLQRQYSAH